MSVKKWMWCLHCERAFDVILSREPEPPDEDKESYGESVFDFAAEFEMQLGVESHGEVYANCPYSDCDGNLKDFWWWEFFREGHDHTENLPETPSPATRYPLYP